MSWKGTESWNHALRQACFCKNFHDLYMVMHELDEIGDRWRWDFDECWVVSYGPLLGDSPGVSFRLNQKLRVKRQYLVDIERRYGVELSSRDGRRFIVLRK